MVEVRGYYRHTCVNCGGETDDARLSLGLPCSKCLPVHVEDAERGGIGGKQVYNILKRVGTLKRYKHLYKLVEEVENVNKMLGKIMNSRLWSAQRTWALRIFRGDSFSIVAPTGVGKTLFGMIMAIYFAGKGKRSYIILPTTTLVIQVADRLREFIGKLGLNVEVTYYHAKMSSREKDDKLRIIGEGKFHILVTTSKFLSKKFEVIRGRRFDFIFVDDVDAILRSSKNIGKILELLGFTLEDVEKAYEFVKMKNTIAKLSRRRGGEVGEILREYEKLKREVAEISRKKRGVLVVSTATGKPRGLRVKLFRELLGFEIGTRSELLRNVLDIYVEGGGDVRGEVAKLVRNLGRGGLVYVPLDLGARYAKEIAETLVREGIRADILTSENLKSLKEFINGRLDVLVGVATYYGVMVRGLDLPEEVRYAIFAGVPRFKFSAKFEDPHPLNILRTLSTIREVLKDEDKKIVEKYVSSLRRAVESAPTYVLEDVKTKLAEGKPPQTYLERICREALDLVRSYLSKGDVIAGLEKLPGISLVRERGVLYFLIPDVATYVQASGRTSRLYVGGITRGVSIVVYDDENLMKGLILKSKWVIEDIEWKHIKDVDLDEVMREVDRDREKVRKARSGELALEIRDPVKSTLLIVESPTKARTISSFFGKPSIRRVGPLKIYECTTGDLILNVVATKGHIYDLVTDVGLHGVLTPEDLPTKRHIPVYTCIRRCKSCGYQFSDDVEECPKCGSRNLKNQLEVLEALKNVALEVDTVLVGTDPDVEGEKIAWDITVSIKPYVREVKRVEFHEITKRAILKAINNPRDVDVRLVDAQIVRRIEDRWIGFELSQRLWRAFGKKWLSAGRVQTPVLGWIIERYEEWREELRPTLILRLPHDVVVEALAEEFKDFEVSELEFEIEPLETIVEESNPPPPYTTDKLIEEGVGKLKVGASKIMQLAQDLFETGIITYHRTDSTRVSNVGVEVAKAFLQEVYGDRVDEYFKPRSWGEGGAHECIRPTRPWSVERLREAVIEGRIATPRPLTTLHYRLYEMIFNRFIASQMKASKLTIQKIKVKSREVNVSWELPRIVRVEGGYVEVYNPFKVQPLIESKIVVKPLEVLRFKKSKKPLYTQGDIIRVMREKGIGRPSTYAKIVQTLLNRKYVVESKKAKKLVPTSLGIKTYNYLMANYRNLVSEERTSYLESLMDEIAEGRRGYEEVIEILHKEITSIA